MGWTDPLENHAKKAKFSNDEPVVIYLPPDNIKYTIKDGMMVCDIPVYDQETAYAGIEKICEMFQDFVRGGAPVHVNYPMRTRQINLERLFEVYEFIAPLLNRIKDE